MIVQRQIILDTETTGLRWKDDHRIIEIGCVELIDRKPSGNFFHHYFQPEREIDAGAQQVHGISAEFLADKPLIAELLDEFVDFIRDSEVIIHNASFDVGFLNYELQRAKKDYQTVENYCQITDSLQLARDKHRGRRNSLDALCQRYEVDASNRSLHGALLDARLLAEVYLKMTSGQQQLFTEAETESTDPNPQATANPDTTQNKTNKIAHTADNILDLPVIYANTQELKTHAAYLVMMNKNTTALWPEQADQSTQQSES